MQITAWLFILMGTVPMLGNAKVAFDGLLKRESGSFTPIFGGVCCAIGAWTLGLPWWGIPIVLACDISIPYMLFHSFKKSDRQS